MQREIITLQLGEYANHVGAHWWNLQEAGFIYDPKQIALKEVENDILFRQGLTFRGEETYTPRLLLFDVRSSLRTLPEQGFLYKGDSSRGGVTWNGAIEKVERDITSNNKETSEGEDIAMEVTDQERITGACYIPSDTTIASDVMSWSDYLVTQLHPRSVNLIPNEVEIGFPHSNSYCMGSLCLQNAEFSQLIENQLHFFVEDCDNLQGFQLLSGLSDGYGSLTSQLLSSLSDEYHKSGKCCIPFLPSLPLIDSFDTFSPHLTLALNLSDWLEHASMLTPLSNSQLPLPFLHHQSNSYHTASVLAAAIDTASLIYRIPESGLDMQDYTSILTASGRKLTSLSTLLPFPLLRESTLLHSLSLHPLISAACLTPSVHASCTPITACNIVRGIPPSYKLFGTGTSSYDSFTSPNDLISHEFGSKYSGCNSFSMLANSPLTLRYPFPNIFSSNITHDGFITSHISTDTVESRLATNPVKSIPVSTAIENHNGLFTLVNNCVELFQNKTYLQLFSVAQKLELDTLQETRHSLLDVLDRYPVPEDLVLQSDTDSD
ncbi:Protein misato-like protein 1-like [Oopsacas minuta]|uniref:Protein misato-like protein 1-like n=1 Tax=Oopsacas minuta TaxID=111878 RepID=A0AAV7JU73_9METZ|nr:Protein misato-like protein 1-like [Oopsacas minuta]